MVVGIASTSPAYNCICGKPDKHDKWIQCDKGDKCAHQYAKGWFHTFCVDITEAEAQNFEYEGKEWICMWCVGATKK